VSARAPDTRPLRAELEAEGRARVDAIRRRTTERIADLRARHKAEAERRRAEALRGPERELRDALTRDLARARIAGKRSELEARQALLDRVFERAAACLADHLEDPAARRRMVIRAREALDFVPEGDAVIACSPGVADVLEEALDLRDDLRIETRADLPAGFRIEAAAGALVIDATLERLLELDRPTLAIEVLRRFAGDLR
jgi:vacuolar-type H+-ATPase subunit E/Vma4